MNLVRYIAMTTCCGLLVGCSSQNPNGEAPAEFTMMQEVNDLLRSTSDPSGRLVTRLTDLDRQQSMYPRGHEAVKSGSIVVVWGARLSGEGDGGQNETVVAYEKNISTDGGYVLLSAGTIKMMTPAEFEATPKSGKK